MEQAIAFDGEALYIKVPKSKNSFRTVPIPDLIFPAVKNYGQELPQDKLFHMKDGRWITKSSYRKMWARIIKRMQDEMDEDTAHVFQHNYCTNLCYQIPSVSIKHIAALLGDTEKMVIEVYNHTILEKEDIKNALENALNF